MPLPLPALGIPPTLACRTSSMGSSSSMGSAPAFNSNPLSVNPGTTVTPYQTPSFQSLSTAVQTTGDLISATFPLCKRIAGITFTTNCEVNIMKLSVSLLNPATGIAGIFIIQDANGAVNGNLFDISTSPYIYLESFVHQNTVTGVFPGPTARNAVITLGPDEPLLPFTKGSSLGIYACADNDATVNLAAVLSVLFRSV